MAEQIVENQTRLYLYDLMNSAKEHGFKKDDQWELNLATFEERDKLEREYHPTITMKIVPEALLQVFHSIKTKLNQALGKEDNRAENRGGINGELQYIVAYNLKRTR